MVLCKCPSEMRRVYLALTQDTLSVTIEKVLEAEGVFRNAVSMASCETLRAKLDPREDVSLSIESILLAASVFGLEKAQVSSTVIISLKLCEAFPSL